MSDNKNQLKLHLPVSTSEAIDQIAAANERTFHFVGDRAVAWFIEGFNLPGSLDCMLQPKIPKIETPRDDAHDITMKLEVFEKVVKLGKINKIDPQEIALMSLYSWLGAYYSNTSCALSSLNIYIQSGYHSTCIKKG